MARYLLSWLQIVMVTIYTSYLLSWLQIVIVKIKTLLSWLLEVELYPFTFRDVYNCSVEILRLPEDDEGDEGEHGTPGIGGSCEREDTTCFGPEMGEKRR